LREAGVPGPGEDRFVAPELAIAERLALGGQLLAAVEDELGELQ
jgi:histidine ammonia-lyase